jgi:hypothetical protein
LVQHSPPVAGEDDIFIADPDEHATIRFVQWDKPEDLVDELKLFGSRRFSGLQ